MNTSFYYTYLVEVGEMVRHKINDSGLVDKEISRPIYRVMKSVRTLGSFSEYSKTLSISEFVLSERDDKELVNVIAHEYCHCIAGHKAGHGLIWKYWAVKIGNLFGCKISRLASSSSSDKMRVQSINRRRPVAKLTCVHCGKVYYVYKRGRNYHNEYAGCSCGLCNSILKFEKLR